MLIKAIILAAGKSTRLPSYAKKCPKCLIEIAGKSILSRQLGALEKNGVKDIFIVVGFMKEAVIKHARDNFPKLNLRFVKNNDFKNTNTLYSLALASKYIPDGHTVLQLNGDVAFDQQIIKRILSIKNRSLAAARLGKCGAEEIKFLLHPNGSIAALNKKINTGLALGEAIGINKFDAIFWNVFSKNLQNLKEKYSKEYFEFAIEYTLANNKVELWPLDIAGYHAIDIDYIEDLKIAEKLSSEI